MLLEKIEHSQSPICRIDHCHGLRRDLDRKGARHRFGFHALVFFSPNLTKAMARRCHEAVAMKPLRSALLY